MKNGGRRSMWIVLYAKYATYGVQKLIHSGYHGTDNTARITRLGERKLSHCGEHGKENGVVEISEVERKDVS